MDASESPSSRDDMLAVLEEAKTEPAPAAPANDNAEAEAAPVVANDNEETPAKTPKEGRDEKGRFAPKGKVEAAPVQDAAAEPLKQPVQNQQPNAGIQTGSKNPSELTDLRPPQSWKPAARETWSAIPPEAQREIDRREREMAHGLQESAEDRKGFRQFRETVAPYEGMIRAEGGEPLAAIANLLQTAHALRTAPPAHKAQLVANIIKSFNVPIETLDAALSGEAPQPGQQQPSEYRDPRVDQLMAHIRQAEQRRAEMVRQKQIQTIDEFSKTAEFFEDVRESMADLIELSARRGVEMTPQQAYDKAVLLHPEISEVLRQRQAAKQAGNAQASTQRAKAAASSVKSQPAPAPPSKAGGGTVHDDMLAVLSELSGR